MQRHIAEQTHFNPLGHLFHETISAPSRNDPCRCGSAKKYKKCCLPKDAVFQNAASQMLRAQGNHTPAPMLWASALALYQAGKLNEAGATCQALLRINPADSDALYNLGKVAFQNGCLSDASQLIERAVKLNPRVAAYHCNLGSVYVYLGQLDAAIAAYLEAVRLDPKFAAAYNYLGAALQKQGRLDEALVYLHKAIKIKPDYADAHSNLGDAYRDKDKLEEALVCYQKALVQNPLLLSALMGQGNLYKRAGDFELAEQFFHEALRASPPDSIFVRYALAQLRKVRTGEENLIALLAKARQIDALPMDKAILLHFALGKSLDDIGDYENAMGHFMRGCALKRKTVNYDPVAQARIFDKIIETFDRTFIDRLRSGSNRSELPIFVLGMPRSGTTLVEQIIASHPAVHAAGELRDLSLIANRRTVAGDMPDGFPDNLSALTPKLLASWGTDYVNGIRERAPAVLRITDKMPWNFLVVGLIHAMLPNARIIHVSRDPADTCLSCFTSLFTDGQEFSYDLSELGQYYTGYARLMDHWRNVLPEGAFLDVRYEDLVADIGAQTSRLIAYCGLAWDNACLEPNKADRLVHTASAAQVRQPIYNSSVERWRHYEKPLGPLLEALGKHRGPSAGSSISY